MNLTRIVDFIHLILYFILHFILEIRIGGEPVGLE